MEWSSHPAFPLPKIWAQGIASCSTSDGGVQGLSILWLLSIYAGL